MEDYVKARLSVAVGAAILIAGVLVVETLFTGCSKRPQEKTVVISEGEVKKKEEAELQVNKIIKIEGNGTVKGWTNTEWMLTATQEDIVPEDKASKGQWFRIKELNYNTKNENYGIGVKSQNIALSPDGSKFAYTRLDDKKLFLGYSNPSGTEGAIIDQVYLRSPIQWSNNSNYISGVTKDGILIYDIRNKSLRNLEIKGLPSTAYSVSVKVSDDLKHALFQIENNLYLIEISDAEIKYTNEQEFSKYRIGSYAQGNYTFIDDSRILYTGIKGEISSLYIYDMKIKVRKELREDVTKFSLTNNNYIAYISSGVLKAGQLKEDTIINESVIYTGEMVGSFYWSTDSKKIAFRLGYGYDNKIDNQYVAELK